MKRKSGSKRKSLLARLLHGTMLVLSFARTVSAEEKSFTDYFVSTIDFGDNLRDFSKSYGANALADGSFKTAMVSVGDIAGDVKIRVNTPSTNDGIKTVLFVAPAESEALKQSNQKLNLVGQLYSYQWIYGDPDPVTG